MNRGNVSPTEQMVGSRIETFCQNTVAAVESSSRMRKLAIGILGVWSSGVLAANAYELGVLGETEQIAVASACEETDIACMLVEDGLDVPEAMRTGPLAFANASSERQTKIAST